MPRGKAIKKRQVEGDPRFGSTVVAKLVNQIMQGGKKEVARSAVYKAMAKSANTLGTEPLLVLSQALTNITPKQEVRSRRVGGATYQVPVPVEAQRGQSLAIRWLVQIVRGGKGRPFADRLADELTAAYNNEGGAVKKKEEVHRLAESNRAFAHFRW
ncbi:30S ribosomal protein S7 [candidate division WWE3 bacterium RIFCSPHIGHO2_01_FULL_48_15]|uniref:Small ribosomal subunit protein uS7 n=1 Tax=candidate division WWE3 bacterium RIFCSPHIGHO2_01_FULL_48_15 TaxID=1802619 RepID=A0A1F4VBM1_UNCKA|nr:MAG: 30S ribosomal protein S7 [candidate division WWE3 bacterium RIFCSPHIGHO2_01_FULL_48_15]